MEVGEAYSYVEDLITDGFISLGIEYKGFNVVLKSLTADEVKYLKFKNNKKTYEEVPVLDRLIYSTHFLNGVNFLRHRDENLEYLEELYGLLPITVISRILEGVEKVLERFAEVIKYLEGYCYTQQSSSLWKSYSSNNNNSIISSPDYLCSSVRDQWASMNKILDGEKEEDLSTGHALFIASAFNPKGVKSVSNSLKLKKEEREKEREEIAKYGYSKRRIKEKAKDDKWSKTLITNEDMVRELNRVLSGKKDKHDLFIDEWMRRKSEAAKKKKEAQEERSRIYREEIKEKSLDIEGTRRADPNEIEKILKRNIDKKVHVSNYSSAYEDEGKSEDFIKKIGSRVLKNDK